MSVFFKKTEHIDTLDEKTLAAKYKATNDTKYVGELYVRYAHLVLGLCIKYLKNEHKAQDAVMGIFEQIMTQLKKHEVEYFKSWLYTLSKNYCLQILRKEQSQQVKSDAYTDFAEKNMESDISLHLNDKEAKEKWHEKLEKALPQLKEEQQKCITLFYLEEKSYSEITEITGYTLKEVKSYIQNGKRNLKIKMTNEDGRE